MSQNTSVKTYSPTILVAKDYPERLEANSEILAAFNQVYVPVINVLTILNWTQQHQPDLIVLDIAYSDIVALGIVSTLRLDWLTRKIPIVIISNVTHNQTITEACLDCDAYLARPCSIRKLETTICSFVPLSSCQALLAGF